MKPHRSYQQTNLPSPLPKESAKARWLRWYGGRGLNLLTGWAQNITHPFMRPRIFQKVRGGRWAVSKPAIISNRKYRSWQTNNFNQGGVKLYLTVIEY